jgi:hypothetical protein
VNGASSASFKWEIVFHHDTHTHPFLGPITGTTGGNFTIPTSGETSTNVWYRIHLTVTDSEGLTHSTVRDVLPRTVNITIAAQTSGPQLTLDDQPIIGTHTVAAVVGMIRTIGAPSPQGIRNWNYIFVSWSDGGPQRTT